MKVMQWVSMVLCGFCRHSFNHWSEDRLPHGRHTWGDWIVLFILFFIHISFDISITLKTSGASSSCSPALAERNFHHPLLSSFYSLTFGLLKQKLQLTCHLLAVKRCVCACACVCSLWLVGSSRCCLLLPRQPLKRHMYVFHTHICVLQIHTYYRSIMLK